MISSNVNKVLKVVISGDERVLKIELKRGLRVFANLAFKLYVMRRLITHAVTD